MPKTSVYFIESGQHIKIGLARNVESRIADLQTGSPYKLRLVDSIEFPSRKMAGMFEQMFHNYFYEKRAEGEWFYICDLDVWSLIYDRGEESSIADFVSEEVSEEIERESMEESYDDIFKDVIEELKRDIRFIQGQHTETIRNDRLVGYTHYNRRAKKNTFNVKAGYAIPFIHPHNTRNVLDYWLQRGWISEHIRKDGAKLTDKIIKVNGISTRFYQITDDALQEHDFEYILDQ